jgi:hypothetical protein
MLIDDAHLTMRSQHQHVWDITGVSCYATQAVESIGMKLRSNAACARCRRMSVWRFDSCSRTGIPGRVQQHHRLPQTTLHAMLPSVVRKSRTRTCVRVKTNIWTIASTESAHLCECTYFYQLDLLLLSCHLHPSTHSTTRRLCVSRFKTCL